MTFSQHHYCGIISYMLDHMLSHYVIECIIIHWKTTRCVEIDHASFGWRHIGIQPAGQGAITCSQMQLLRMFTFEIITYLALTSYSPNNHPHVIHTTLKSSPNTKNKR